VKFDSRFVVMNPSLPTLDAKFCLRQLGRAAIVAIQLCIFGAGGTAASETRFSAGILPQEWSVRARGGAVHQFDSELKGGGSFTATRASVQVAGGYSFGPGSVVSLSLGYDYDSYDFSGQEGLGARDPWAGVNSIRIGLPIRWRFAEKWSAFLIPTIRSTGESGARFEKSIVGGGFTGVSYRFGDSLTIGPGIGVIAQLEDDPQLFPVIIVDWKITQRLRLETGRALGATLGPGLALTYRITEALRFSVGGRYERFRFRLDEDGEVPDGIGEEQSFPLFAGLSYAFRSGISLSLVGGAELSGKLRLEDASGRRITSETYDPSGFLGMTFNWRL